MLSSTIPDINFILTVSVQVIFETDAKIALEEQETKGSVRE
jgi:hypothetical protein